MTINTKNRYQIIPITTMIQLQQAHKIRIRVFVDEQHAPREGEIDAKDPTCTHWLAIDTTTTPFTPLGTIRLVPIDAKECALGRLCLDKPARGLGIGRLLVETMLQSAKEKRYTKVSMHAQTDKMGFYLKCGFIHLVELGDFMEDGIPHVYMAMNL